MRYRLRRPRQMAPILIDRTVDQFSDLDGFASQIAAMDTVVAIDNSTAHLAGSLGVPTCVLLPFAADWRWFEKREDSPWYPTSAAVPAAAARRLAVRGGNA